MTVYDFSVIKGDTFEGVSFQLLQNTTPVDLTGASIRAFFRTSAEYPTVLELSTEDSQIVIDVPLQGRFSIVPQIIDIAANRYLYDIEITFADNSVKTYIQGTMEVLQDITY